MPTTSSVMATMTVAGGALRPRALRRVLQALASALDRLLPARPFGRYPELPPEWFKYPRL